MKANKNSTPAVCYGEILWDVLPEGPQPGGAPLNVAYHLNKMGVSTSIISKIGNDSNGRKLVDLVDSWGINREMVQKDEVHPTSEVIAHMSNGNEVSYDIVFPVAWDFIDQNSLINEGLSSSSYLIYGSLASRHNVSRDTLLGLLECDAIKVFDINLRPPFINKDLLGALLSKADIVKFNQGELEMAQLLFGGSFSHEKSQIKFIQDRFEIPEIIVTKGEFGAAYYKNDQIYQSWGSEVKVRDTIGSGDAFLAAFIANHYLKNDPLSIIKNAVAMGAFIATKKGGCPDYFLSEFLTFKNQNF